MAARFSAIRFEGARVCSLSPDGTAVAVGADGRALIANPADGSVLYQTDAIGQLSDCRLLSSRRLLFTSDWDCELVVWDMEDDRPVARYEGHTYTANCCSVTPDGRLSLTGGGDDTVRLWSPRRGGQRFQGRPSCKTGLRLYRE